MKPLFAFLFLCSFACADIPRPAKVAPDKRALESTNDLVGRVLKGKTDQDFLSLSNDPDRKIVFLMGADGLKALSGSPREQILEKIGYTHDYVARLKGEGHRFKLVTFSAASATALPGTWENVIALAAQAYPPVAVKIKARLQELKDTPFEKIQAQASAPFATVDQAGRAHPDFIDEKALEKRPGSLWEVRAFLYYRLRLMDLYAGDGWTRTPDGSKGMQEYVVLNRPLAQLGSYFR